LPAILLALLWTLASATSGYSAPTTLQPDSDPAAPTAPVYRWRQVNVGLEDPFAMQFSSGYAANGQIYAFKDFNTLYVGHGYGAIFRSETHGATWGVYASPPPSFQLVAVSPETPAGPVFLGVEDYYDADGRRLVFPAAAFNRDRLRLDLSLESLSALQPDRLLPCLCDGPRRFRDLR
jgi:hypothetical protein